jgi:hypothetical protein
MFILVSENLKNPNYPKNTNTSKILKTRITLKILITMTTFLKMMCLNGWPNKHRVLIERMPKRMYQSYYAQLARLM